MNASKPWIAAAVVASVLTGCASTTPAPVLLTLPPLMTPASAAAAGPAASAPLLEVRRVGIPEYLVARRVRYRADPSTLGEWPNTYWGERIEIGVSRQFVAALRQQLPGWALCEAHCSDQVPALTLQVEIVPMDYLRSARKLEAQARIAVSGAGSVAPVLQVRESSYEIAASADTPQAQAEALGHLIEQVAAAAATLVRATR